MNLPLTGTEDQQYLQLKVALFTQLLVQGPTKMTCAHAIVTGPGAALSGHNSKMKKNVTAGAMSK